MYKESNLSEQIKQHVDRQMYKESHLFDQINNM